MPHHVNSGSFQKGHDPWHKGKKGVYSEETRKKMGEAKIGKTNWRKGKKGGWALSEDVRKKLSLATKGKKRSVQWKEKRSGENHYNWQGGKTPENLRLRNTEEYRLWRTAVFERDKYTCIWCGDSRGGNLEADHIKPWAYFPELRFAIDNGRTLCVDCHKKTDTWGWKAIKFQKHER